MISLIHRIGVAALLAAAAPAMAAPVTAGPAPDRSDAAPAQAPAAADGGVPDLVVVGLGISGLLIVGAFARRRQPGRSVTH